MAHDPAELAANYLGGEVPRRQRDRYQRHLLECEDCWREVQAARRGQALAESLREVAPQRLRERVRATVEATPASGGLRRRWSASPTRLSGRGRVLAAGLAEVDRVVLFCADRPWPALLVGQDRAEVLLAAQQLRLH